jgi:hypothetical protein
MVFSDVAWWPFLPALVFAVLMTLAIGLKVYEVRQERKRRER